jgi:hypothetical protein
MQWLRTRTAGVAAAWLAVYLCLLVSAPTTLCSADPRPSAKASCECPHEAGTLCPMHQGKGTARPKVPSRLCSCRSAADPLLATVASLLGPLAVLTPSTPRLAPPVVVAWTAQAVAASIDTPAVPDSPPPRL